SSSSSCSGRPSRPPSVSSQGLRWPPHCTVCFEARLGRIIRPANASARRPLMPNVRVFDPTGHIRVEEVAPAPRPASLEGLRPGILENRKANARALMEAMVDALRERVPLGELTVASKPVAGPPAKPAVELIERNC